ncbi:hypothetical protein HNR12_003397 [Streptomonospora nanhaiensis]|uniref:Uncharacterized protein n=1 Tax=Streptomonospora nanhaiensis TaxID=1323731 RepID=A0A853BQ42_9ACTN|nr:hypothetical protein [Streptomonospora nanhaiensis]NYI97120.1 hypothetical protein [Streptomonospora nanhaiensis]
MTAPEPSSVLDKALKLQSEIRRLDASNQGVEQAKRVAQRVDETTAALSGLRSSLEAAKALATHTAADMPRTSTQGALDTLRRKAAGGLPDNRAFTDARRNIERTAKEVSAQVEEGWHAWAQERLASLPLRNIPVLERTRQDEARRMLRDLRKQAAADVPTATTLTMFLSQYDHLKEQLEEFGDVPEELVALFERLDRGGLTLRDLTDEEVALLRTHAWDGAVELRRKEL